MDHLNARPQLLKQANLCALRRAMKQRRDATRAELAELTAISSTTVRALLTELLEAGEIEAVGHDDSSGGRKALRYRLVPDCYLGAAFCLTDTHIDAMLVNVCGEIIERTDLPIPDGDPVAALTTYLDQATARQPLRSIGVGVPGVVEDGCFLRKRRDCQGLFPLDLGGILSRRYGLPVVLENDLNATAIGLGRCYAARFPEEDPSNIHMTYLHFEAGCVSAGSLSGGRLIRGCGNFAGELGLVPATGRRVLDEIMMDDMDDKRYVEVVLPILGWICGILNPRYIALGGPSLRRDCIGPLGDGLAALLPRQMAAELLFTPDCAHDYRDGMAHLTAEAMFGAVQIVKE